MKFIPLSDNNPRTINIALESLHRMVADSTEEISTLKKKLSEFEKAVIIESSATDGEEITPTHPDKSILRPDAPSMKEYSPEVTVLTNTYGLTLDWSTWEGYGNEYIKEYKIYCSTSSTCPITSSNLYADRIFISPYTLSKLSPGVTYYMRVIPVGIYGTAGSSEVVSGTVVKTVVVESSPTDPTTKGEMVIIPQTIVSLCTCDAMTGWSAEVGTITFEADNSVLKEGTASLKIISTKEEFCTAKYTVAAKDLSSCTFIKLWVYRHGDIDDDMTLYFGESAYNEQSKAVVVASPYVWTELIWDISAIGAASKNAVTLFAIKFKNTKKVERSIRVDDMMAGASELLRVKFSDAVYTVSVT